MDYIELEARGKINLGLDVLGKRNDGYHNISTIMQEIDLADRLRVKKIDQGFVLESNLVDLPRGEGNIVYQAWILMKEEYNLENGIEIHIEKNIPMAAGLAGGSTNAAATIRAIDRLWQLDLTQEKMESLGLRLGADVPFCLRGGTLLAQGLGQEFTGLGDFRGVGVLLVNPNFPISTQAVYQALKGFGDGSNIEEIQSSLDAENLDQLRGKLYNKMEVLVFKDHPELVEIKKSLLDLGAAESLMSGSGPTVFGIFSQDKDLDWAYGQLKEKYPTYRVIKTKTL